MSNGLETPGCGATSSFIHSVQPGTHTALGSAVGGQVGAVVVPVTESKMF